MAAKVRATDKQWKALRQGAEAAARGAGGACPPLASTRRRSEQPPERDIVAHYIGTDKKPGILRACGWYCIRLHRGKFKRRITVGEPGMADWLVARVHPIYKAAKFPPVPMEMVFVEFKRPGEKPEPAQIAWAEKMRRRGFDVRCVDRIQPPMLEDLL